MNSDAEPQSGDGVLRWLAAQKVMLASPPVRLTGGASSRVYFRVRLASGQTRVVMSLPAGPRISDEIGAAEPDTAELPFVQIGRWLRARDVPVPTLDVVDAAQGYLMMEDLGDRRLYDARQGDTAAAQVVRYGEALDLLHRFQAGVGSENPGKNVLSAAAIAAEFEEFVTAGIEHRQGLELTEDERAVTAAAACQLTLELAAAPQALAHRDFQSQNIMCTARGLVLIDYQDCFLAPFAYDLVALLRDSYVVLDPADVDTLVHRFFDESAAAQASMGGIGDFQRLFHVQTVQRKLKDAGRFVTLAGKGKPEFLRYYPDSIRYAMHALRQLEDEPAYADLAQLLSARVPEAA
jgi:aminoglycoside/choline kinase family phosphotransferase